MVSSLVVNAVSMLLAGREVRVACLELDWLVVNVWTIYISRIHESLSLGTHELIVHVDLICSMGTSDFTYSRGLVGFGQLLCKSEYFKECWT